LEVIVVDDGSTDNSLDIARQFAGRYDEVCAVTQSNRGAPAARNRGLQMSDGPYVQFLDADDRLVAGKLHQQVAILDQGGTDVVTGSWRPLVEQDASEREEQNKRFELGDVRTPYLSGDPLASLVRYDGWAPPAAQLMTREIVERVDGWDESLSCMQDVDLLVRIALDGGRFDRVDDVCAHRRELNCPTVSTRDDEAFKRNCFQIYEQLYDHFDQTEWTDERKDALVNGYGWLARSYFEHNPSRFDHCLRRLHQIKPGYVPPPDLPTGNRRLHHLSRWIGYRNAERVAFNFRRLKSLFTA
jgi:glycosyltransferase involved in cell wall biosynthesis